jgi:hypothetical protein
VIEKNAHDGPNLRLAPPRQIPLALSCSLQLAEPLLYLGGSHFTQFNVGPFRKNVSIEDVYIGDPCRIGPTFLFKPDFLPATMSWFDQERIDFDPGRILA